MQVGLSDLIHGPEGDTNFGVKVKALDALPISPDISPDITVYC
jgi:hypothetical protein